MRVRREGERRGLADQPAVLSHPADTVQAFPDRAYWSSRMLYDPTTNRLDLSRIAHRLSGAPRVAAHEYQRLGLGPVQRVHLGRVEELSPSRSYWGPCHLISTLDDRWPFDFDSVSDCGRCSEAAVQRWMKGFEFLTPCTPEDPCHPPWGTRHHCGICRDAAWFHELSDQLELIGAVLLYGSERRSDLYVVRGGLERVS